MEMLHNLDISGLRELLHLSAPAFHILIILLLSWLAYGVARRLIGVFKKVMLGRADNNLEELKRVETLSRVFRYVASVLITIVTGMLILSELGISIAPILAAAGVLGLAVGFGAQSLVKDYFSGLFLLLENQVRQGDVVEVAGKSGLVEEVTLRYIRLRDYDGNTHFIPNGIITTVTNMSRGFAQSVIDIGVAYREDVDEVITLMQQVGAQMRQDDTIAMKILDNMEIAGVDALADSSVRIKCRFKVLPLEQWGIRREFLKRIKKVFDANDIEIPFPHLTIYQGQGKAGDASPLNIRRSLQKQAELTE